MSDHEDPHLTDGQIVSSLEAGQDTAVRQHIESCAECRTRVEQWREACAFLSAVSARSGATEAGNCPEMEELAGYAVGQIGAPRADAITAHVAGCARCAAILRNGADESVERGGETIPLLASSGGAWRRRMAETFVQRQNRASPHYRNYAAAAAIFLVTAGTLTFWWNNRRSSDPAVLLAKAYTAARPFEYRLADSGYGKLRQQRGTSSRFERPPALDEAAAAIRRKLDAQPNDPVALGLKGRTELLEGDYTSAIESLERAKSEEGNDPDVLADLAAAYAIRGDPERRSMDYGHAAELLLEALKKRPGDQRMQFNLAIIYEKMSQVDEAAGMWRQLLRENPPAGWRQEAEAHLAAMEKKKAEKKKADDGVLRDPDRFLAAYGSGATFDPLPWFEIFWMDWLPKAASDRATAGAARVIASGFKRYGEYSLSESLEAPASAAKQKGVSLLASAMAANRKGRPGDALGTAREAAAALDAAGMRAAAALARNEFVYAARWLDMYRECRETADALLGSLGPRYPWLVGNAHLNHSACVMQQGDEGLARIEIEDAKAQFARAGLWPMVLRAQQFVASVDCDTGNYGPVWGAAADGLQQYWTTQASNYRAQAFQSVLQQAAEGMGWQECSMVFYRAAAELAHRIGNGEMEAFNRSGLARVLHRAGDYTAEVHELDEVNRILGDAGQSPDVQILRWETALNRVRAGVATNSNRDPLPELERLALNAPGREATEQIALEQTRGLALAGRGDYQRAAVAYGRAIDWNWELAESSHSWLLRVPALEAVAESYRNLAQIELTQNHDPAKALAKWRRFRSSAGGYQRSIHFAVLPAGVVIWTVDGERVQARWADVPADELTRISAEFLALCATPRSSVHEIHGLGNRLYRALVRPELQTMSHGTISLTADSWLAEIPFGALTDDAGEYLCHRFSFVQSYGPPRGPAGPVGAASPALIVAVPKAAAPGQRELPALPGAEREAAEVAARFSSVVVAREATSSWLAEFAPRAAVFHFCGHGWSNGGNGALILPPGPDGEPRYLTSTHLAAQNWSQCRLAVLSACLTAAGETRGVVNNQSLVQAMLGAGARRVVAARWSIDSEATRALMDAFYARLVSGKSVPEALFGAAATVAAVPGWSHPYYWAGFDLFGSA